MSLEHAALILLTACVLVLLWREIDCDSEW